MEYRFKHQHDTRHSEAVGPERQAGPEAETRRTLTPPTLLTPGHTPAEQDGGDGVLSLLLHLLHLLNVYINGN